MNNKSSDTSTQAVFDAHTFNDWEQIATKSLKGSTLAELQHITANNLAINPLYHTHPEFDATYAPASLQQWSNRLAPIAGSADEQNKDILSGLQGGIHSLEIHLQSDERVNGIPLELLPTLLNEVYLNIAPLSIKAGSNVSQAYAAIKTLWDQHGVADKHAALFLNSDPMGTLVETGCLSTDIEVALQNQSALLSSCSSDSKTTPVGVNVVHYHNAGASAEQELTAAISTAALYVQHLVDQGHKVEQLKDCLVFQVACDADWLSNVVKLRALRRLWMHTANQLGIADASMQLVVETSKRMQSRRDIWVNQLRNVSAATAGAMCDSQAIIVHPHNYVDGQWLDDQVALGKRMARNIAHILQDESKIPFVHDPTAGSYAIESLTDQLIQNSWQSLQQLESNGGLLAALQSGQWQTGIRETHKARIQRLESDADVQIGVNRFNTSPLAEPPASVSKNAANSDTADKSNKVTTVEPLVPVREAMEFEQ